jgi:hypothetical protein
MTDTETKVTTTDLRVLCAECGTPHERSPGREGSKFEDMCPDCTRLKLGLV